MKKVQIRLQYREKVYFSDISEINQDDFKELEVLVEKISRGNVDFFSMKNLNYTYHFPKKILNNSIISIIIIP